MNETAMPAEDRLRHDEECRPPLPSDEAGEQGDERPVRPGEAGSADLATKDRHMVAQHEDLGVLGEPVPPRQLERSKGAMDQAVKEGEHHGEQPLPTVAGSFWTLQVQQGRRSFRRS
jgi:hypothetical protein